MPAATLMFTGIVEAIGRVKSLTRGDDSAKIEVFAELPNNDLKIGDSVAVNGVCLTVTSKLGNTFWADIGLETLKVTTLKGLQIGAFVNVERPLQIGGRLGGHLVQCHVDGVGKVLNINKISNGVEVDVEAPVGLSRYLVLKGSVAINGVSLTISKSEGVNFSIFLIPHTVEGTTFKYLERGAEVNLEVDIIGKYVEKLTHIDSGELKEKSNISEEFLRRHGF